MSTPELEEARLGGRSVEQVPLNPPDTALHLASMLLTGYLGFVAKPSGATA